MTKNEIIKLARETSHTYVVSRDYPSTTSFTFDEVGIEAFANLVAKTVWAEGYQQGVADEDTSEANIGIAGFIMKINPARENPYKGSRP